MYNRITSKHIINIDVAIAIGRKGVFYIALTDNTFIIDLLPSPDKVVGIEIFIIVAAKGEEKAASITNAILQSFIVFISILFVDNVSI